VRGYFFDSLKNHGALLLLMSEDEPAPVAVLSGGNIIDIAGRKKRAG
jgi:hypothetical protein